MDDIIVSHSISGKETTHGRPAVAVSLAAALACMLLSCTRTPIIIGAPLGLTGLTSAIGVQGRNGMEIAVD
jgi:hypothetical protein